MKHITFYEQIIFSKPEMHSKTIVVWFPKRMAFIFSESRAYSQVGMCDLPVLEKSTLLDFIIKKYLPFFYIFIFLFTFFSFSC